MPIDLIYNVPMLCPQIRVVKSSPIALFMIDHWAIINVNYMNKIVRLKQDTLNFLQPFGFFGVNHLSVSKTGLNSA